MFRLHAAKIGARSAQHDSELTAHLLAALDQRCSTWNSEHRRKNLFRLERVTRFWFYPLLVCVQAPGRVISWPALVMFHVEHYLQPIEDALPRANPIGAHRAGKLPAAGPLTPE
jgi:hypothetical protein